MSCIAAVVRPVSHVVMMKPKRPCHDTLEFGDAMVPISDPFPPFLEASLHGIGIGSRAGGSLGVSSTTPCADRTARGLSQPQPSTTTTRTSHDSLFHYNDVTNPPGHPQRGMDIQLPRDSVWAWSSAAAESRSQSHQLLPTKFIGRFNHYRCFLRTGSIPIMVDLCPVGTSTAALPVLRE